MSDARTILDRAVEEKTFQQAIVDLARLKKWLVYHPYDSRRSERGFPDLVCVRGPRLIFAEVKTERGKPSTAQQAWLDALGVVAGAVEMHAQYAGHPFVEVCLWRPHDWPVIEGQLA